MVRVQLGDNLVWPVKGQQIYEKVNQARAACQETQEALGILKEQCGLDRVKRDLKAQLMVQTKTHEQTQHELYYTEGDVERIIDYYRTKLCELRAAEPSEVPLEAKDENVL